MDTTYSVPVPVPLPVPAPTPAPVPVPVPAFGCDDVTAASVALGSTSVVRLLESGLDPRSQLR